MYKFIVIAFLAVTFSCQCQAIDPFAPITRLKSTVNSISNDLQRYGSSLIYNTRNKVFNLKIAQMENVNKAVNKALDDTRNNIAAAKNQGKDADHCYEPTRLQLRAASQTVWAKLDKCMDDELALLNPVKSNIDSHITRGKMLLSELDGIALSCASGNQMQAQLCVAQKMPGANASVNNYDATAKQLKSTGDSLSNNAPASVTRCFQQPMSDLYTATSEARISANQCISSS